MRYRKLDSQGDMRFGHAQADFWIDQPEAVAQAVATRLRLELGEWFVDTTDGTDWRAGVLGERTRTTRDPIIRERILGTPGVTEITAYQSVFDPNTRAYTVTTTLATQYGAATLTATL